MEINEIVLSVVSTVVATGAIHYLKTIKSNKDQFEQMGRAIYGEKDIAQEGLIDKVADMILFKSDFNSKIAEIEKSIETLHKHDKEEEKDQEQVANDLKETKDTVEGVVKTFREIMLKWGEVERDMPKKISEEVASQLNHIREELKAKANKETLDAELKFIVQKIDNVVQRIESNYRN